MEKNNINETFYWRSTEIWKRFCDIHSELLDITLEEYNALLEHDLDKIEKKTSEKKNLIEKINTLNKERITLIDDINKTLSDKKDIIKNVSDLLNKMTSLTVGKEKKSLLQFNSILIDLIGKIQNQNKKNHLFINKAVSSIEAIQSNFYNNSPFKNYDSKGIPVNSIK